MRTSQAAAGKGRRIRPVTLWSGLVTAVAVLGTALLLALPRAHRADPVTAHPGPEGVALQVGRPLADPGTAVGGRAVDGIACQSGEQVAYHVHVHLAVVVDGRPRPVPAGIGIAAPRQVQTTARGAFVDGGSCFYWLHTHAADGIIHVESPSPRVYTLGDFFDIWHQPLSGSQVGPVRGRVTVFVDGHRRRMDPRAIALTSHREIQLDVGTPIPRPNHITFPSGL